MKLICAAFKMFTVRPAADMYACAVIIDTNAEAMVRLVYAT